MFLFYEITAGKDKEHFICKFFVMKLTTAVFSYTEKSSQKLDRDPIRTHRESQKNISPPARYATFASQTTSKLSRSKLFSLIRHQYF